jgi:O-succinylbenzoic acid--CoA ligase
MQLFSPLSDELFEPTTEFERQVQVFCMAWKSGQSSFLFHTSGSTGAPKPILLERKAMEASALCTGEWLNLKPSDVALVCLPVHYIAGAMVLVRAMVLDLRVCLVEPSVNPLEGLAPVSIQLASFVPNQWHALLESQIDLSNYFQYAKGILLGGAALSEELKMQSLGFSFPIFETYGMTETVSHVAYRSLGESYFKAFDTIQMNVDQRDCLKINGPVTGNEWIQTNDIVRFHGKSRFELLGRYDRVINSAGRKIHPELMERFISSQEFQPSTYFLDAIPDSVLGQQLCLFYTGEWSQIEQENLQRILRNHFDSWELPKQYIQLSIFQFTSSGKIDRLKSVALYLKSI